MFMLGFGFFEFLLYLRILRSFAVQVQKFDVLISVFKSIFTYLHLRNGESASCYFW